jgi:hypothetical protein
MANSIPWIEWTDLTVEDEDRRDDAVTLEALRWHLLQASARLSTARLILSDPSPTLDATEEELLEPLEAASREVSRSDRDLLADLLCERPHTPRR